jgi:MOSC domain-containing protein YiiM
MKYRRQTLAHKATDAGPCVCRLTLAAQCCSVMAHVSVAAMLERQTLMSASVASGVCSAASLDFDRHRVTSVAEATDASIVFGRARGGSDRRVCHIRAWHGAYWTTSVDATDARPRSVGHVCC